MVEPADCIFDRPHHIRNVIIFLGRRPRIWRGKSSFLPLRVAKVTAAGNSHVFGLMPPSAPQNIGSRYMDDTDIVSWEGFPIRRLLRGKLGGAFHLWRHTLTTALAARSG